MQNIRKASGGAAPSGIPVASTASVVISGNATFNGTAVKKVNPEQCFGDPVFGGRLYVGSGVVYAYGLDENYGKILIPPQATTVDEIPDGLPQIDTPSNTWRLVWVTYNSEENSYVILNTANNSSTDANYIPTSGWFPSITITAAPSGIPVATTNTINVVDTFGYNQTKALIKSSSTLYFENINDFNNYTQVYCEAYSDNVPVNIIQLRVIKEGDYWIYRYIGSYDCVDEGIGIQYDIASVLEVTSGIIPTTGWSPSLTITAA